jgi:hypothetical protein
MAPATQIDPGRLFVGHQVLAFEPLQSVRKQGSRTASVYPRSFADADGDGVGDLRGPSEQARPPRVARRRRRLTVADLPVADAGLRPRHQRPHGNRSALRLARRLRRVRRSPPQRGLRVLLDFVPNHTPDEDPWFAQSPDFYQWRDPAPDGGAPNNWLSLFGGPGADRGLAAQGTLPPGRLRGAHGQAGRLNATRSRAGATGPHPQEIAC